MLFVSNHPTRCLSSSIEAKVWLFFFRLLHMIENIERARTMTTMKSIISLFSRLFILAVHESSRLRNSEVVIFDLFFGYTG